MFYVGILTGTLCKVQYFSRNEETSLQNWPLGVRKWRRLKAVFEDSESGISIGSLKVGVLVWSIKGILAGRNHCNISLVRYHVLGKTGGALFNNSQNWGGEMIENRLSFLARQKSERRGATSGWHLH